jgi:hypothetical protein
MTRRTAPTAFAEESIHTDDIATRTLPTIDTDADRESVIEPVDKLLRTAELAQEKFMNDVLTIRIERGREKHAPQWVDVYVNGVLQWVKIGEPQKIKRKFVEVLARSQPFSVQTDHGTTNEERPQNRLHRSQFAQYPFSVLHDPSPMGNEWLQRVYMEN